MDPRERRAFPRHPAEGRATLSRAKGVARVPASGELFDISTGGVCIMLQEPPAAGEQVSLELHNPSRRVRVRIVGQVVHVTPHKSGWYRVGCAFANGAVDIQSW